MKLGHCSEGKAGAFRGISRATADIAYFRLSGSQWIIHDLTLAAPGGEVQLKLPASFTLPTPLYVATCGTGTAGDGARKRIPLAGQKPANLTAPAP